MTQTRYRIVHTEFSQGWGGQEIRIYTEMLAMRERGHHLLLAAPASSNIYQKSQQAGLAVFKMSERKAGFLPDVFRLAGWFRREQVQIVNMHSSRDGWIGGLAARLAGVPLIIRSRHIEVDYPNRLVSRIAFHRLPHHVLTTSDKISGRLIQELGLLPERVNCIPTGIDVRRYHPAVEGVVHRELGLPVTTPIVGMISVLRSWKGHAFFLEAAAELVKQGTPAHFIIAGDGPGRDWLPKEIERLGLTSRVKWLGHREDVQSVLASLAVLVLPSTAHEGVPQIVLQAQATAKPVVGTTVGGIPEVVADGETGFLAPPKDGPALARLIQRLLQDPALRERMGQKAREKVEAFHSLDYMCGRLEEIYRNYLVPKNI